MHDVFISYSHNDKNDADMIVHKLEENGIRCWYAPRDVSSYDRNTWAAAITKAIMQTKVMVIVFSDYSNQSDQVIREVDLATKYKKTMVPFMLENVDNMREDYTYYFASVHWLDAMTPPKTERINDLYEYIKKCLERLAGEEDKDESDDKQVHSGIHDGISESQGTTEEGRSVPQKGAGFNPALIIGGIVALLILLVAGLFGFGILPPKQGNTPVPAQIETDGENRTTAPAATPEPASGENLSQNMPVIAEGKVDHYGYTVGHNLVIRQEPDTGASAVYSFPRKEEIIWVDEASLAADGELWCRIFTDNNKTGYLQADRIALMTLEDEEKYRTRGNYIGEYTWKNGDRYESSQVTARDGVYTWADSTEEQPHVYDGGFSNGKREGYGILKTGDGVYEGEWKENLKSGTGKYTFANSTSARPYGYEGEWDRDTYNGHGTFIWPGGDIYEGEYKNGLRSGQGRYTWADNTPEHPHFYEGEWVDGRKNGQGKIIYTVGDVYEGEWKDNRYSGQGKYIWADSTEEFPHIYEGEWVNDKKNGHGNVTYPNGNRYEGEWKDDQREGQGKLLFASGDVYEGEWKADKFSGQGKYVWADSTEKRPHVYEGQWADNMYDGQGKLMFANGVTYEGEWKEDKKNGWGIFTWADSTQEHPHAYEGEWLNGKKHGRGKFLFANGDIYEGEWESDKISGQGKYVFADSTEEHPHMYEGMWANNRYNGQGKLIYSNGDIYEGEWKDEKRNGWGIYTWADSTEEHPHVYEGEFLDGEKSGQGKITFSSGDSYKGRWENDCYNGQGKYIWADSTDEHPHVFEGEWADNTKNGHGKIVYASGETYDGEWKDDKKNGQGTFVWPTGEVYVGEWKDSERNGQGKMTYPDGDVYEGEWKNDRKNGHGTMTRSDGEIYTGEWKDGKKNGQGRLTWADNTEEHPHVYSGGWLEDHISGFGRMTYPNGDIFEGEWKEDVQNGRGKMVYSDGSSYTGTWKNGEKDGEGKYCGPDGIEGDQIWVNGVRQE